MPINCRAYCCAVGCVSAWLVRVPRVVGHERGQRVRLQRHIGIPVKVLVVLTGPLAVKQATLVQAPSAFDYGRTD